MPAKGHPAWAAAEKNRRRTPKMRAAVVESFFDATIFSNLGSSIRTLIKKFSGGNPKIGTDESCFRIRGFEKRGKEELEKGKKGRAEKRGFGR